VPPESLLERFRPHLDLGYDLGVDLDEFFPENADP